VAEGQQSIPPDLPATSKVISTTPSFDPFPDDLDFGSFLSVEVVFGLVHLGYATIGKVPSKNWYIVKVFVM
jgi:hypothetical protein